MRRLVLAMVIGALVALPGPAAADFAAGVAAYDSGDYATAFAEWLPLAENGDAAAQRNVGHLYRKGQGVEQDLVRAAEWYRRAAETGFARAQANLASMYLRGDGVPQDYAEAAKWFERAAIQGHSIAQYNLAVMYERGLGVEQSEPKALAWYYNAARAGHEKAADRLASLVIPPPGASEAADAAMAASPSQEPGDGGAPVSDAQAVAVTAPEAPAAGLPDAAAPVAGPAPAAASEWRNPDLPREGGETALADAEAPPAEEAAAVEQETQPRKPNAALRFIFGFNNDILVRGTLGDDASASPPSDQDEPEQEPVGTPADDGAARDGSADDQDTENREVAGIGSAPSQEPSQEAAVTIASAAPAAAPTMATEAGSDQPGAAPPSLETSLAPAAADGAPASRVSGPSETVRQPDSLARWVMLAGAQTSGDLARPRDPAGARQAAASPAQDSTGGEATAGDERAAGAQRTVPPLAPSLSPPPQPGIEQAAAAPPGRIALLPPSAAATPALDTAPSGPSPDADPAALLPLAEAGDAAAQFALGRAYLEGSGVPPDDVQAYLWWALAADQNHGEAARALRSLVGRMDSAQIAAGEILIDNSKDHR